MNSVPTATMVRRYRDAEGAAEYLGMTVAAVRKAAERRVLPFTKLGKKLVFDTVKLDAYLNALPGVGVEEAVARKINSGTVNPLPE